jgi:Cu+-exporting ATPase
VGWRIFFLADPWIQLVWATLLQLACGWPFLVGALRGPGARRGFDALITLGTWSLFGYGLYLTVFRPHVATHPYFQLQSVLILTVTLDRLTVAVLAKRRLRTH